MLLLTTRYCMELSTSPIVNRMLKDSGLNHIVKLIEIMQLGAKPQCVEDFPPLPSVAWSLFLMTWLLLLPRLASSPAKT